MADEDIIPGDEEYGDGAPAQPKPSEDENEGKDDQNEQEAILPKSILGGKEFGVGDELTLKITAMHENEISVKYAAAKDGDESAGKEESAVPAGMGGGEGDADY